LPPREGPTFSSSLTRSPHSQSTTKETSLMQIKYYHVLRISKRLVRQWKHWPGKRAAEEALRPRMNDGEGKTNLEGPIFYPQLFGHEARESRASLHSFCKQREACHQIATAKNARIQVKVRLSEGVRASKKNVKSFTSRRLGPRGGPLS
jgi:hypothetical protein